MGGDDPEQPVAALDDEGGIGHDDFEPGLRIIPEGDTAIENEPVAGKTVKVQVHADLARPAERDKEQRSGVRVWRTNPRAVVEIAHCGRLRR